jgi:peptide/nickel transport system permease protein
MIAPRLFSDGRARFALVVLGAALAVALAAPLLVPAGPAESRDVVATRFLTPFTRDTHHVFHLLGTDRLGRDVWSRLAYGSRVSLATGLLATLIATALGALVGATAGVWQGRVGLCLMGLTDFFLALPRVVLLLLLAALWQPSGALVVIVLGCTGWMSVARLVHGEARALMARDFVATAHALGAGRRRVTWRHVLPNVRTPIITAAALSVGNAIMLEAGLSFLGLGVQPPSPSWGGMIASGRDTLVNAPWVAVAPGVALVLVVVACTMLGDALSDRLGEA